MVRKIIDAIKSETGYKDKAQLLNYLYNTVSSGAVKNEVCEEIGKLFLDLANAIIRDARPDRPYKENCEIIACQNAIMGISMKLWPDVSKMPLELAEAIRAMLGVMNKIRELELYVEEVCAEPKIDARNNIPAHQHHAVALGDSAKVFPRPVHEPCANVDVICS